MMKKTRILFDISLFDQLVYVTGIPRVALEVLQRFLRRDDLEVVFFCSLDNDESAWRHFQVIFPNTLPFRHKFIENYVLPEKPTPPPQTRLRRFEEKVKSFFPKSRLLRWGIEGVRAVKWKIKPPPPVCERPRSVLLERLIRESDVYISLLHRFVPEIDVNPNLRKVMFVYDLIPHLFPEMSHPNVDCLPEILRLLTPEVIVLAISEHTRNDLLEHFPNIKPEQVTVIPLGADERFVPCVDAAIVGRTIEKYGVPPRTPYILSVATLEIRKNFDHVIRSFARFVAEHGDALPEVRLVLTGAKGWKDEKIKAAFEDLAPEVRDRVIFTGYVADADLPLLYAGAACFCYMSVYEGFGLPPLEAMSCGTPVITSNRSSLPEVVGEAGIQLDPHDEAGLVDAFYRVLTDAALRQHLVAAGLEQSKKFSWDQCVDVILGKILVADDKHGPL